METVSDDLLFMSHEPFRWTNLIIGIFYRKSWCHDSEGGRGGLLLSIFVFFAQFTDFFVAMMSIHMQYFSDFVRFRIKYTHS